MTKKKKERFSEIRFSLFSLACLFFCWVGVTFIAFHLGFVMGNAGQARENGNRFPIYERVGEPERSPSFSYPKILGEGDSSYPVPAAQDRETVRQSPRDSHKPKPTRNRPGMASGAGDFSPAKPLTHPAQETPASPERVIQVASFRDAQKAERLVGALNRKGYRCFFTPSRETGAGSSLYRVFVGPFSSLEGAARKKAELEKKEGFEGIYIRHGTL